MGRKESNQTKQLALKTHSIVMANVLIHLINLKNVLILIQDCVPDKKIKIPPS